MGRRTYRSSREPPQPQPHRREAPLNLSRHPPSVRLPLSAVARSEASIITCFVRYSSLWSPESRIRNQDTHTLTHTPEPHGRKKLVIALVRCHPRTTNHETPFPQNPHPRSMACSEVCPDMFKGHIVLVIIVHMPSYVLAPTAVQVDLPPPV